MPLQTAASSATEPAVIDICSVKDLVPHSGVAALIDGDQIAIFFLPEENPQVYAVGNFDPIGGANVMSRGIVGDVSGALVVASPLYKQHFSLVTGQCIEQSEVSIPAYRISIADGRVMLHR